MKFVIQRVDEASVSVGGDCIGAIRKGFVILIGVSDSDTEELADRMLEKALKLRIFEDEDGKTNCSLEQVDGQLLLISQFTLYANCRKGHRPSFTDAGKADHAKALYEYILEKAGEYCPVVQSGAFGEHMKVSLCNSGPFTILLDSAELFGQ